jgi:hypothetical protein
MSFHRHDGGERSEDVDGAINAAICHRPRAALRPMLALFVVTVEKAVFLTNGRQKMHNFATFIGLFDFSYSLVSGCKFERYLSVIHSAAALSFCSSWRTLL